MTLGTSLIFSRTHSANQHRISPFVHSFSHQRARDDLVRTVAFPDVVPRKDVDLDFEQGDFLSQFSDRAGSFDAIVTLFFIDTVSSNSYPNPLPRVRPAEFFFRYRLVMFSLSCSFNTRRHRTSWIISKRSGPCSNRTGSGSTKVHSCTTGTQEWNCRKSFLSSLSLSQKFDGSSFVSFFVEKRLEDVVRAAELVGFEIEKRRTLEQVRYTADEKGEHCSSKEVFIERMKRVVCLPARERGDQFL